MSPATPRNRERSIFLAIAAAIVGYQIFLPPTVGMANNGDFGKVAGIFNLTSPAADENRFADNRWTFDPKHHYWAEFYSSEQAVLAAAVAINSIFSKDGTFDLRAIGAVHAAAFLLALYLLWGLLEDGPRGRRIATCAAALFCFGDVMFVAYLNSFYMDVAAYLCLMLAVVLYLRWLRWRRAADAIWFAVCCAIVITSKAQHAVLGLWMAFLVLVVGWTAAPKQRRAAAGIAAAFLMLSGLWLAKSAPPDYPLRGVFSCVFYQILPHSKDVTSTMRDLGLDESYRRYAGLHSYAEGSPMSDPAFLEKFGRTLSYRKLAWFYITHPRDAYMGLRWSLDEAGRQRPYLGNFDVREGLPPFHPSRAFAFWSDAKRRLFEHKGSHFFFAYVALAAAVIAGVAMRQRRMPAGTLAGAIVLAAIGFTALCVASLADAVDIPRHHFVFYALFDMTAVAVVYLVADLWCARR